MSRYYSLMVECIGNIEEEILSDLMVEKFGWTDWDTWINHQRDEDSIIFTGKGSLYSGESEEEAHERISKHLKSIDSKMRIKTTWTYLEDLPYTTYGSLGEV